MPPHPGPAKAALRDLANIVNGEFDAVTSGLDSTCASMLDANGLRDAWAQFISMFGEYRGRGEPSVEEVDGLSVVRVRLEMAEQPGELRVTYDAAGRIAGLYFLRTGVPLAGG